MRYSINKDNNIEIKQLEGVIVDVGKRKPFSRAMAPG